MGKENMVCGIMEAAKYCGVSRQTIIRRIREGAFPAPMYEVATPMGQLRMWHKDDLSKVVLRDAGPPKKCV